ncbi:hypothetical protein ACRAWF_32085 [Streptomyces sp. L7]
MAFTSLIGTLTRPKEMAPFHMDRTCRTRLPIPAHVRFVTFPWDSHRMTPITEVEGEGSRSSNLEKVLHPADGFT